MCQPSTAPTTGTEGNWTSNLLVCEITHKTTQLPICPLQCFLSSFSSIFLTLLFSFFYASCILVCYSLFFSFFFALEGLVIALFERKQNNTSRCLLINANNRIFFHFQYLLSWELSYWMETPFWSDSAELSYWMETHTTLVWFYNSPKLISKYTKQKESYWYVDFANLLSIDFQ